MARMRREATIEQDAAAAEEDQLPGEPSVEDLLKRFLERTGRDESFDIGGAKELFQPTKPGKDKLFIKDMKFNDAYDFAKPGGKFLRDLNRLLENADY